MATTLARGPARGALSTKDNNLLVFPCPKAVAVTRCSFFEEAVISLCSSGLEQAHFRYYCLEITGELSYQNQLIH